MIPNLPEKYIDKIEFNGWTLSSYKGVKRDELYFDIAHTGTKVGTVLVNAGRRDGLTQFYSGLLQLELPATTNSRPELGKWVSKQISGC